MPEPAANAITSRVLLLAAGQPLDVFELIERAGAVVRVRTAYLFELGEELTVRIEDGGGARETTARVRAHTGAGADTFTELELTAPTDGTAQPEPAATAAP